MKKALSAVLAVIVMATVLAGCNNSPNETSEPDSTSIENSSSDSSSSASSSSSSTSSESSSSESSSSESSSSESSSSEISSSGSSSSESSSSKPPVASIPSISSSSSSSSSSVLSSSVPSSSVLSSSASLSGSSSNSVPPESKPSSGYNVSNEYGLDLPNTRAGELAAKALAADSWGNIGMLDEELVNILVSEDLKFDLLEDYCFLYPMITGRKMIILIAKPKAGDRDAVKAIFDAKYDYYKNDPNAAFYLAEQEDVAGTVSGVTSDGYYYIIVHKNGSAIQSAVI